MRAYQASLLRACVSPAHRPISNSDRQVILKGICMKWLRLLILTIMLPVITGCTLTLLPAAEQGESRSAGNFVTTPPTAANFPTRPAAQAVLTDSDVYYQAAANDTYVSLSFIDAQNNIACQIPPLLFDRGESIYASSKAAFNGCPGNGSIIASANRSIVAISDLAITLALTESTEIKHNIYQGISHNEAATDLFVPDLYIDTVAPSASLYVQNAAGGPNSFELTLLDQAGNVLTTETYELAQYGMQPLTIHELLAPVDRVENGPLTAHIRAANSVATSTVSCRHNLCTANSAPPQSSTHWFVPALVSSSQTPDPLNHYSTLTVVNVEEQEATITVSYGASSSPTSYRVPAMGSLHLTTLDFPESFTSDQTVEVQAESPLLVTAQFLNFIDGQGAAYNGMAIDQGSTELFLPRVTVSESVESVVYLQNLSETSAVATLSLYAQAGPDEPAPEPITITLPELAPLESQSVNIEAYLAHDEPVSWIGAALIQGSAPMSALILTKSNAEPHWATGYNAVTTTDE